MDILIWERCVQKFAAKLLSEFSFEGLLSPEKENEGHFKIGLSNADYLFEARESLWKQVIVNAGSIRRKQTKSTEASLLGDILVLLNDIQPLMPCSSLTWSQFVNECINTLYSDYQLSIKHLLFADEDWSNLPTNILHSLLDGHPKALTNKGRVGWGAFNLKHYAPEAQSSFRLVWIAIRKHLVESSISEDLSWDSLYQESLSIRELHDIKIKLNNYEDYLLMPVHPWQWDHMIALQFVHYVANKSIVYLGELGDFYQAQPSLRTLSNTTYPKKKDIKLALTILNTSSYRGMPGKYLKIAPKLSAFLKKVVNDDDVLNKYVRVQAEPAGLFVPHPFYEQQEECAYQWKELLGVVWRESAHSKCIENETAYMAAILHQLHPSGVSLVETLITNSQLSAEEWLIKLFDCTAIPLWHWQCAYGLGFISHGQNLQIIFENFIPKGILIKDIQGDLFVTEDFPCPPLKTIPTDIIQILPKMPPHYLVHNLWTGFFASVLRFTSFLLSEKKILDEKQFWQLLSKRLQIYMEQNPDLKQAFSAYDLFCKSMPRLCINKARLVAGYNDTASRPVHSRGQDILNPLYIVKESYDI
ncbi:hypothetical protein HMPREF3144_02410 [Oligella sp. HMSC05A10]|uniref:IucA/IucC family protein n=1 Tax=Oligella TaxID=90243 RepID=UPI0008A3D55D|nr:MULTISPECIES: IucA/IucC family protein [Oligella]AVL70314.1 hypothetical protein CEQ07_01970 [Oligella urethralis]OFS88328.1 hypothetical protein HMPREF3144_02410 [Oligella sp. HMSC05A10]